MTDEHKHSKHKNNEDNSVEATLVKDTTHEDIKGDTFKKGELSITLEIGG